ncbi:MAG: rhodanese-like domain-containing protein [Desulfovibrionaceae bacterium]
MKKCLFTLACVLLLPVLAHAADFNYISQDETKQRLASGPAMILVDICPADMFAKGHLPGSLETNAYPVKTDEERARLDKVLPQVTSSKEDVVIVCPGGAGGAQRTYTFFMQHGVDEGRLKILEKGMKGWPYQTEKK